MRPLQTDRSEPGCGETKLSRLEPAARTEAKKGLGRKLGVANTRC